MSEQLRVMISSTARDLPEHRQKVMDACMRLGMFYPDMMEHLTATDANALEVSLKIADRADLYVGVFAFRYGYVPDGHTISVTEAEYDRAVKRDIPRLIFLMSDQHDIKSADVETGTGAIKLANLKERLKKERVVGFFDTSDDLKAQVIQALVPYRESDVNTFHYISNITEPPEEYIAHPYTLMQTHTLIGRQPELKVLTDWITSKQLEANGRKTDGDSVRIMSVIAIGGMGKSALTWKWFTEVAPKEMKTLVGRMWWNFYESDATFENFVTRGLAYVTSRTLDEVERIPAPEREVQLLAALDHTPFLLVLDGLERILIGYARMDASRLHDIEVGKEKGLRKTSDPRVGGFLKKLAQVKRSFILISSRLHPIELETDAGDPIPKSFKIEIQGLSDEDAVELWRAFNVSGSREELLPVFDAFGKHPLLIQALAGEVKRYRKDPGNFEEWRKAHPRFDPSKFPDLTKAMAHVLEYALRGLEEKVRRTLYTIAAFRMPTTYDTLSALLVGKSKTRFDLSTGKIITDEGKLYAEERNLDDTLTELEDRGLLGWDKRANRYDLHPIVRSVVWGFLEHSTRRAVYISMEAHLRSLATVDDYLEVEALHELTPAIELYNTLIGLERYDDAYVVFRERLQNATLYRLSASRLHTELLGMLFPRGLGQLPPLKHHRHQAAVLGSLALAYQNSGSPARAVLLFQRDNALHLEMDEHSSTCLGNMSYALQMLGGLRESLEAAFHTLGVAREDGDHKAEGIGLYWLGLIMAELGIHESTSALRRSVRVFEAHSDYQQVGVAKCFLAQRSLWFGEFHLALSLADEAWELAHLHNLERDICHAARRQGVAALELSDFPTAEERLQHALTRARVVDFALEELPALVGLAELHRRQNHLKESREFLNDVWELVERGPYKLFGADAFNVLVQIERDEGHTMAAVEAATKAYRLAWCDGPPFAYHWGLEKAKQNLKELGAPEPKMSPFDESKCEPMLDVEINPDDEFYVADEELG